MLLPYNPYHVCDTYAWWGYFKKTGIFAHYKSFRSQNYMRIHIDQKSHIILKKKSQLNLKI